MGVYEIARSAWPAVVIAESDFLAYVAERVPEPGSLEPPRLQELYLACACARGDPEALSLFRRRFMVPLGEALSRSWPAAQVDDVLQHVQVNLLVAAPGVSPRITQYKGGSLQTWVKVMSMRELRRRSAPKGMAPVREEEIEPASLCDPEHEVLLQRHRPEIQAALRDRVQALPPEDRMLLKLSLVDGVSTVKLAQHLGVNQSTAWRRLEGIKGGLAQAIHAHLKQRFNLSSRELESMMNALRSSLDLSISQIFGSGRKGGKKGGEDA